MAYLEYVDFQPWREIHLAGFSNWEYDQLGFRIPELPQIFWESGESWAEANLWALEKLVNQRRDIETAKGLMKHLHRYACFLEDAKLDWRHFPIRKSERAIVRFRGDLIRQIKMGSLAASTGQARINAIVQFYRFTAAQELINPTTPMWREHPIIVPYYDSLGFKRGLQRTSTDLAIPNRPAPGIRLEDGLIPLSDSHMTELLQFTARHETRELHLMLTIGFFIGARLQTIATLRIENLETARPDNYLDNFYLIRVGPGTGVSTKLDVQGDLLIPTSLYYEMKDYAYSVDRIKREAKAENINKSVLFLTTRGKPYRNSTIGTLMTGLRRKSASSGLKFMISFKFHQTRATYGTWLMKLALSVTSPGAAIEFVKSAMLHKHEATTFRYIKFIETSKGKQHAAKEFNEVFTGLKNRNWDNYNA